ncbi:hypothetical protein GCM10010964_44570 [Caldovatus sediminis]|uniref:Uncharacterized protein n=1 Tax=Caldovatus sediminis TaxID=2041189 RepID=A0A8J3EEI7_9PROT|nr:hypothetical protein GCM10010964_44570 [Caldovatus sediminis]
MSAMRGILRTVLAMLILALMAGTVLHATRAAAMDLAMAAAAATGMAMPGCDGCGDDGGAPPGSAMASCAALCATPPMAPPSFVPQLAPSAPAAAEPIVDLPAPVGLAGPPDLHPPRTIVLS